MAKLSKEAKETYLEELNQLARKYGIYLYGCGCCSSPQLVQLTEKETTPNHRYRIKDIEKKDGHIEWSDK